MAPVAVVQHKGLGCCVNGAGDTHHRALTNAARFALRSRQMRLAPKPALSAHTTKGGSVGGVLTGCAPFTSLPVHAANLRIVGARNCDSSGKEKDKSANSVRVLSFPACWLEMRVRTTDAGGVAGATLDAVEPRQTRARALTTPLTGRASVSPGCARQRLRSTQGAGRTQRALMATTFRSQICRVGPRSRGASDCNR
eukprot:7381091-Prymnesium_polylepis.1